MQRFPDLFYTIAQLGIPNPKCFISHFTQPYHNEQGITQLGRVLKLKTEKNAIAKYTVYIICKPWVHERQY